MPALRLAVFGVTGRMGQSLLRVLRCESGWRLSGALASASSSRLGEDALGATALGATALGATALGDGPPGVRITADPRAALRDEHGNAATVALDFSIAAAVASHAEACADAGVPLLVGATGLDSESLGALRQAAQKIPVLLAPNTSVGVGVLAELVRTAGAALGHDYDVEIHESHHRMKRDAPSGTALRLGEIIAAARGQTLEQAAVYARHGVNEPRTPGSIGFSVLRAGDIVGEHTVVFAGAGERLELTHRATDRDVFARGALRAAEWLAGRAPGTYGMQDVLRR
jgi:4-hydroxy-tetrahydrodipicolinate reductase